MFIHNGVDNFQQQIMVSNAMTLEELHWKMNKIKNISRNTPYQQTNNIQQAAGEHKG